MKYPYITENNLEHTQEYNYTAFCGKAFLHAYLQSRESLLNDVIPHTANIEQTSPQVRQAQNDDVLLRLLIKTFEINKRLYGEYEWTNSTLSNQKILKPNKNSPYNNINDYIAFGIALGRAFEATNNLLYLNTLLKLNDTLLSLHNNGGGGEHLTEHIQLCIRYELRGVAKTMNLYLLHKNECLDRQAIRDDLSCFKSFLESVNDFAPTYQAIEQKKCEKLQIQPNLAMIYSLTPRSELYLQTMQSEGIAPSAIIILSDKDTMQQAEILESKLKSQGLQINITQSKDINNAAVFDMIKNLTQEYIIYSGYGGGILKAAYFELGKHFIHIHAGKLPQYKGSTTCYYSLLEEGSIHASAMFLDSRLDCGAVIGEFGLSIDEIRKLNNSDIDTTIEPYIRAKALVSTFKNNQNGFSATPQEHGGETYYRIHPTLKHLAIFKCFGNFHAKENI